jgi:choline kinase
VSALVGIVLAAGVGSRLRPLTDALPKCLVEVGGASMLARAVRLLADAGAREVIVSTGYLDAVVRAAMASAPVPVRFAHNPDYDTTQNVVSLQRALALVPDGCDVVKLDGDVVFEAAVLARLLAAECDACAAIDDAGPPPDEAMKVRAEGGRVVRFGKGLDAASALGESIGIERFAARVVPDLARALSRAIAAGRTDVYYEDVYNDLVAAGLALRPVSVGGLRWNEVDDVDDLARARALFPSA